MSLAVAIFLAVLAGATAQAPAQAPAPDDGSLEALRRAQSQLGILGPASHSPSASPGAFSTATQALSPAGATTACPEQTILIPASQLVNQSETACIQNGTKDDSEGRFGRNTPFGFRWNDTTPTNCTIFTVTVALQSGISCTGIPGGGNVTLNNVLLPETYRFPFVNEYNGTCSCLPPAFSPIQVFNLQPGSAYCQGCENVFSILGSTGTNGLKPLVPQATGGIYAVVIVNQWVATGFMQVPRTSFGWSSTPVQTALAAGGISTNSQPVNTAEDYNYTSGTWSLTNGRLQTPVSFNQVANLQSSSQAPDSTGAYYLISAGGVNAQNTVVNTVDLFNTSSRNWTAAPTMNFARARFQLTTLYNGTNAAVATGGIQGSFGESTVLGSAEVYDIDTNSWRLGPLNMSNPRYRHTTVVLPIWSLLAAGGQDSNGQALNSSELLNLDSFEWTNTGSLNQARFAHTATVLKNGSVLVTGGAQKPNTNENWTQSELLSSCELYTDGVWTYTGSLVTPRADHAAVILSDGTVLVAGGATNGGAASPSAEIWSPTNGQWTSAAPMLAPSVQFGMVRFDDDKTITYGGSVDAALTRINGTTVATKFATAVNATALLATASPAQAPALSPSQVASIPGVNVNAIPPSQADNSGAEALAPGIYVFASSDGLSAGVVVGIVLGAIGGCALLLIVAFFVFRYCRKKRRARKLAAQGHRHKQPSGLPVADSYMGGSYKPSEGSNGSRRALAQSQSGPSTVGMGFFRKLSSYVKKRESHESEVHTQSIELPKGVSSPFDTANAVGLPASSKEQADPYRGVQMSAGGVLSPFASPFTTTSSTGKRSVGDPTTGNSVEPLTQNTGQTSGSGEGEDRFNPVLVNRQSGNVSHNSLRSDLSRVSVTIQNELHAAEWKIERSALDLGKRLGKGGFGEVFEGMHYGSPVAVKVLELNDERMMLDACQEFGFLHGLRHSKLVISYGACVDGSKMLLVMERMEEDLFHAIASDQTMAGDSVLWYFRGWRIALDVASALVFLHSKGLVHLDVKSLNILLKGHRAEAKLGDLGLARLVPDGHLSLQQTLPGTPAYSAPEVIQAQLQWRLRTQGRKDQFKTEVGTPADIFAFGVVLFEICTGCHPARWRKEFTGELRPEQAPPAIAKLIDDCLNDEPHLRPTAQQVLKILLDNKPPNARD